jgi:hypothetical protein
MELVGQRRNVAFVIADFGYSERQACKLLDLDRTSYRYRPKPERNAELRAELIALARQKPRYSLDELESGDGNAGKPSSPRNSLCLIVAFWIVFSIISNTP